MRQTIWTICILFTISLNSSAQELWDLEKCVNHAWSHSLNLIQSEYNERFESINLTQAKHARNPNVNGSVGVGLNFGRSLDPTTNGFSTKSFLSNQYSLSAGMTLFNGFRIRNQLKQSGMNLDAAQKDTEQLKRDIALDVASAYLNALFAQESMNTARNVLNLSSEQLSQVDKLIAAGSRPRNERLELLAQIATNEQELITNENNLNIALLSLKQLMNYNIETDIKLVVPDENAITLFSDPDLLTFAEVYQMALTNQPFIEAGKIRLRSAEMDVEIAEGNNYPSISAGGSLSSNYNNKAQRVDGFENVINETDVIFNGQNATVGFPSTNPLTSKNPYFNQLDQNLGYGVGVNMNIPIYNNYQTKAQIERAKLNVLNTETQNELLNQRLRTSVQQALADAQTAKKAFEASQKSVEAQQAAFRNAEKRFELGAINTYDYILAKNQYDNSEIRAIIAKYDYIFKMKILDFYLGRPLTL